MIILEQLIVILGLILTNGLIPWAVLCLPAYQAVLSVAKFQTFETVTVRGGGNKCKLGIYGIEL